MSLIEFDVLKLAKLSYIMSYISSKSNTDAIFYYIFVIVVKFFLLVLHFLKF